MSIFANVAEISAERMEELAGTASLRDAGTTAGIATDKMMLLSGDPQVTIHHDVTLRPSEDAYSRLNNIIAKLTASVENRTTLSVPDAQPPALLDTGAQTGLQSEKNLPKSE